MALLDFADLRTFTQDVWNTMPDTLSRDQKHNVVQMGLLRYMAASLGVPVHNLPPDIQGAIELIVAAQAFTSEAEECWTRYRLSQQQ